MISPSIGRVVWYTPSKSERESHALHGMPVDQVLAAHVAYVHSDREVNLLAITPHGTAFGATNVPLLQDDDARPEERFCEWMPFQKGQAKADAKT